MFESEDHDIISHYVTTVNGESRNAKTRGRKQTMLQKSTASPLFGFTHNPSTIFPPQLHSPDPA